jgi:1,4-dihydroxy-2-naphthoate octaprenyltransferase
MSVWVLIMGILGIAGALAVGVYLTERAGWPILAFAILGGLAAVFYVAPPIRWAYRGLGETVIALSYGPWMVLGSLYLHAGTLAWGALWASLIPGLLIMALAVVNAIPDFHQDRLVGKRNLVVRLGRRGGVFLYLSLAAASFVVIGVGVWQGVFPATSLVAFLALPLLARSAQGAIKTYEKPRLFVPAIRRIVTCYVLTVALFTAAIAAAAWHSAA